MSRTIFDTPLVSPVLRQCSRFGLKLFGWRTEGTMPNVNKAVLIAAPHTSNWDLPVMLAVAFVFRVKLFWVGKHTLFRWPFGFFLRWMGGIPFNRSGTQNLVARTAEFFQQKEKLILAIAPEGTRQKVRYWKTGFYYIAQQAGVPIVMSFCDFSRKVAGVGPMFIPTGDLESDLQKIQAFYAHFAGKNREQTSIADIASK